MSAKMRFSMAVILQQNNNTNGHHGRHLNGEEDHRLHHEHGHPHRASSSEKRSSPLASPQCHSKKRKKPKDDGEASVANQPSSPKSKCQKSDPSFSAELRKGNHEEWEILNGNPKAKGEENGRCRIQPSSSQNCENEELAEDEEPSLLLSRSPPLSDDNYKSAASGAAAAAEDSDLEDDEEEDDEIGHGGSHKGFANFTWLFKESFLAIVFSLVYYTKNRPKVRALVCSSTNIYRENNGENHKGNTVIILACK